FSRRYDGLLATVFCQLDFYLSDKSRNIATSNRGALKRTPITGKVKTAGRNWPRLRPQQHIYLMRHLAIFLLFGLFVHTLAFPQQTSSVRRGSLNSGTIDSQFIYLNQISRTQDDFKLIRRVNLETVRKNVADSLRELRNDINESGTTIKSQQS